MTHIAQNLTIPQPYIKKLKQSLTMQYELDQKREDIKWQAIIEAVKFFLQKNDIQGYNLVYELVSIISGQQLKICLQNKILSSRNLQFSYDISHPQNISINILEQSILDISKLIKKLTQALKEKEEIEKKSQLNAQTIKRQNIQLRKLIDQNRDQKKRIKNLQEKLQISMQKQKRDIEFHSFDERSQIIEVQLINSNADVIKQLKYFNQKYVNALAESHNKDYQRLNLECSLINIINKYGQIVKIYKEQKRKYFQQSAINEANVRILQEQIEIEMTNESKILMPEQN